MKILMLCEFYHETLEYQENLLVKYYRKHGHDVTVVTSTFESLFDYYNDRHDSSLPERRFHDHGALIIRLPYRYNFLNRLRAYRKIDRILEETAPDLIYVHDIMPNLPEAIRYLKRHPGCRMILDYHCDYSNSGRNALSLKVLHGIARKWFLDRARPHLSRIFPVVPASATFLHEIYKVPHEEMEVLPLGADVDLAREIIARGERAALREKLGIPADAVVILTGGKLAPPKRTEILFDAVARLPHLKLHVLVAGEAGKNDAEYKQRLLESASRNRRIHFLGWLGREDIYRYLGASDLAVFPASQSILWQQAIAAGLPLVAGNSGHQDISYLNLCDNIVVLQRDDITQEKFAAAIEDIVSNPARMRAMAEGAIRVASEHLDWNKLIERTLRFNRAQEKSH